MREASMPENFLNRRWRSGFDKTTIAVKAPAACALPKSASPSVATPLQITGAQQRLSNFLYVERKSQF